MFSLWFSVPDPRDNAVGRLVYDRFVASDTSWRVLLVGVFVEIRCLIYVVID
jgi:hypothetical protein